MECIHGGVSGLEVERRTLMNTRYDCYLDQSVPVHLTCFWLLPMSKGDGKACLSPYHELGRIGCFVLFESVESISSLLGLFGSLGHDKAKHVAKITQVIALMLVINRARIFEGSIAQAS